MKYAETLSPQIRRRAAWDAICSALCGCVAEMTVDTGAIVIVYIAMLHGGDASRMLSTGFAALAGIALMLPAARVVERVGLKKAVSVACSAAFAAFLLMAGAAFLGPGAALPVFLASLFLYNATRPFYVAAWFPLLDGILRVEDRTAYFCRMRFLYNSLNAALLFTVGLVMGRNPPVWILQAIIAVFGLGNLGRAYFIRRLPVDPAFTESRARKQKYGLSEGLRVSLRNSQLVGFSAYFCMVNVAIAAFQPLSIVYLKSGCFQLPARWIMAIASTSLVGGLLGFLAASGIVRSLGKKAALVCGHVAGVLLIAAAAFLRPGGPSAPLGVAALQVSLAFVHAVVYAIQSGELLALARPGNETVAAAVFNIAANIGTVVGRFSPSLALGLGVLAPAYFVGGVECNQFQTLFGIQAAFLLLCLVLLPTLPALVPHRDDYYDDAG